MMVNVGKYSIHGSSGHGFLCWGFPPPRVFIQLQWLEPSSAPSKKCNRRSWCSCCSLGPHWVSTCSTRVMTPQTYGELENDSRNLTEIISWGATRGQQWGDFCSSQHDPWWLIYDDSKKYVSCRFKAPAAPRFQGLWTHTTHTHLQWASLDDPEMTNITSDPAGM